MIASRRKERTIPVRVICGWLLHVMAEREGFELEPFCGRQRSGSPQVKS
jgi:hypothetical protein